MAGLACSKQEGGAERRAAEALSSGAAAPAEKEQVVEQQQKEEEEEEKEEEEKDLEGIASLALLPSGSLSGHFLHPASSTCLGLFGTEIACERECSRGEDYRLLNLTIINFGTKKETTVVVERKGQDAARLSTACNVHGWDEDVVREANDRHSSGKKPPVIHFECETLKADREAEDHLKRFLPSLVGSDAVVNIGRMTIKGLEVDVKDTSRDDRVQVPQTSSAAKRSAVDLAHLLDEELDAEGLALHSAPGSAPKRRAAPTLLPILTTVEAQEHISCSRIHHSLHDDF